MKITKPEVIVRFVDIGGIVDHHYSNFLFIMTKINIGKGANGPLLINTGVNKKMDLSNSLSTNYPGNI